MIERHENWKKIYIKNTYYWCDFFSFVYLPPVMNMCNLLLQSIRRYQRNNQQKNKCSLRAEKVIAKYRDVTLNFLYMWEKASEWKQLTDGCPFQLIRDSTIYEQTHLDFVNQHRFHIRKERILSFKNWLYRDEIQSATEFHRTLTLLTAKIFSAELARVVYSKKNSPLLFLETLSRWKWNLIEL